jgi:hypothetical protein
MAERIERIFEVKSDQNGGIPDVIVISRKTGEISEWKGTMISGCQRFDSRTYEVLASGLLPDEIPVVYFDDVYEGYKGIFMARLTFSIMRARNGASTGPLDR